MFSIRRAALRLLTSPSTSFVSKSRTVSTFSSPTALRLPRQSVSIQFQRRWATGEAEAPISKLQPTAEEEVENAISEDNSASTAEAAPASEHAPAIAETANATEATEETLSIPKDVTPETSFARHSRSDRGEGASERAQSRGSSSMDKAEPKPTIYVGNLFFDVTEDDLTKELSRFGTIQTVKLIRDPRGLSKGFGYVTFQNTEQATSAVSAMNQTVFEGRRLNVQYATLSQGRGPRAVHTPANPPSKTLFIGNMSWEMTDKDLNSLFRGIRNVIDVRVAIDRRTGQPRGFAHADFVDIKSAMEAMKVLEGKETYGRKLKLDYSYGSSAAPRNQAKDSGSRDTAFGDSTPSE